jgi:hypothetical protein
VLLKQGETREELIADVLRSAVDFVPIGERERTTSAMQATENQYPQQTRQIDAVCACDLRTRACATSAHTHKR